MKKILLLCILIIFVTGCTTDNPEKATNHILKDQENGVSVIVFTSKPLEDSYRESLQKDIDYINNNLKKEKPILHVSFINVEQDGRYDYETIFELKTYPQILLFENDDMILKTNDPDELVQHYENESVGK
ncbi:hypothetical protein [Paenibacillus gallinarum]|uniref:Small peptidoglycan-associated lipoprotein n=1 Tax=Paenibacillus gallinarum TaxID=2762232 RepID=A0ABR8SSZ7_9BACL|nr:hypothetical protein [Paenibacillus gallinarum]MBD7966623.1 hypothetical protein [Paenibacillus gallinarum]